MNRGESKEPDRMPLNRRCRGMGFRARRSMAAPSEELAPAEEVGYLEETARRLEHELKSVRARIEKLQSDQ